MNLRRRKSPNLKKLKKRDKELLTHLPPREKKEHFLIEIYK
jgi:hypothetical protein